MAPIKNIMHIILLKMRVRLMKPCGQRLTSCTSSSINCQASLLRLKTSDWACMLQGALGGPECHVTAHTTHSAVFRSFFGFFYYLRKLGAPLQSFAPRKHASFSTNPPGNSMFDTAVHHSSFPWKWHKLPAFSEKRCAMPWNSRRQSCSTWIRRRRAYRDRHLSKTA